MDCQVWGAVNEYWRGEGGIVRCTELWIGIGEGKEGGIVRCRELWIGIGEGREGLSGVGSYV